MHCLILHLRAISKYKPPEAYIRRGDLTEGFLHYEFQKALYFEGLTHLGGGGGGTPLCDLNGDVRPDRVWFLGCFVLNGVSISSLSVLNRVSLHDLNRINLDDCLLGF